MGAPLGTSFVFWAYLKANTGPRKKGEMMGKIELWRALYEQFCGSNQNCERKAEPVLAGLLCDPHNRTWFGAC